MTNSSIIDLTIEALRKYRIWVTSKGYDVKSYKEMKEACSDLGLKLVVNVGKPYTHYENALCVSRHLRRYLAQGLPVEKEQG